MRGRRTGLQLLLALALLVVAHAPGCKGPPSRQKIDQVYLRNGDRLTGEIKQLEQGKLRLKTSDLDSVYIEWNKIEQLASQYAFAFEDESGKRHYGRITGAEDGRLEIADDDGSTTTLPLDEIVEITPIDQTFWARLDGNISLGYSYSKGSDIAQWITSGKVEHRTRAATNSLDFSSTMTQDSSGEQTSRNTVDLGLVRYRNRWFGWATGSLEQNESLGLDLRTLLAGGGGRSLVSTNRNRLDVGAGLAVSHERSVDFEDDAATLEGVLLATYSVFLFEAREVDSDFSLYVYPGITDTSRVRAELDYSVRRELVKNLFLEIAGYYSYDSEPPEGAAESDYGINTSLGWSF